MARKLAGQAAAPIDAATLKLEVLPAAQRRLWDELGATPPEFVLYGGTAIALRLGHRRSVDFDFFAFRSIDPERIAGTVAYLSGAVLQQLGRDTATFLVMRRKPVSVSFFGLPKLKRVREPDRIRQPQVKLASMLDLAGVKMAVVARSASPKDYLEIHAILRQTDIRLQDALAAATLIYGPQFNPYLTLKALSYFGEPDLEALPGTLKADLERAVAGVDVSSLGEAVAAAKRRAR